VRRSVATNPNTARETLARLDAGQDSPQPPAGVAANREVPLAHDRNQQVLLALVNNADTPDAPLDEMTRRLEGSRPLLPGFLRLRVRDRSAARVRQALEQRRPRPAAR
jgi:uncharacterized membrane protein YccC